ncbi:maleylpyruvate isomerase family mycothiol-dependent enzyme [Pseudonocardia xinjiangensis]|uniref:Maleylpyruvate isomerase family mycothiol-dependent enzyme n=1 Tax=Pseudonocardia xinjiangensis TaxID=75289 RepID=A0ABX1R905_9PSEU|nr:maleylpyruvate isomerase family mycothiol-dependent enzyme [Pseudonocardia xinjiangensis]NMH76862.1 maleylpyruvate isomerase family mycothiol-dependent enzyme [Pseudonocardia xinjiangensis]
MIELTLERYGQALMDQTAQFAETVRHAAADAPVPTCPEWTLSQLVEHVGQTQHWVASIVEKRVSDPSQIPTSFAALPADQDAWPSWLADGASLLAAACVDAGPDAPVWNPAGDARSGTRFWLPRVLAETIIHRADAAATADVAYQLDAELAAGAVSDHLAMMTSPGWAAQRPDSAEALRGSGQTLYLHADDEPSLGEAGRWFIERGAEGATWHQRPGVADVTVRGPATSLLLMLTRRRSISAALDDSLHASGDLDLLTHWVDHTAHQAG